MQQTFSTIDDAGLSTRVRNALVGLQVTDIKQLASLTEHDPGEIREPFAPWR